VNEACVILRKLEALRETDYVDGYPMAFLYDAVGLPEQAFAELDRAAEENSPALFMLDIDPRMDGMRSNPRFTRLRNRLFGSTPAPKVAELHSKVKPENAVIAPYRPKEPIQKHRAAS
jgi:hypothetical protein